MIFVISNLSLQKPNLILSTLSPYDGQHTSAKGLLTGTRTYLLDGSGRYTVTAMYYDYRGQIVQTRSTNHLGGFDITYNQYNFTGLVTQSLKEHSTSETINSPLTELYTHDYDHAGRLLETKYKLNQNPDVVLNDMNETGAYDEIGRLKKKRRHSVNNEAFQDSEEFDYNIRNWATRLKSGTFEEKLFYNTNLPGIVTPCYNGNIAYSSWTYNGARYAYTYKYDDLNRLVKANGYRIVGTSRFADYGYNELFTYDKQGNILNLQRKKGTTFIDWINPAYNGNQMTFANDYYFSQNQSSVKEYHNFNTSGNDFSYDTNGNMTKDLDRKIYTIRYNVLNLPEVIQFKDGHQIINAYDASGQKLSSRYYTVMLPTEVPLSTLQPGDVLDLQYNMDIIDETGTFYVDNKEYSFNGCDPGVYMIHKVYNTEGYANNIQGYYGPNYQYYRKDHLGNNREVWRATTNQTIQKTQYYPCGLPWVKNSGDDIELPINTNTRKYNDKEFVEMHGLDEYDSEARWYYPAIMRTTTMDPLAEKYYDISPYAWCGNNPIRNIDPDGRDPKKLHDWIAFGKSVYKATTVVITVGFQGSAKANVGSVAVGVESNAGSFDLIGVRDGTFTPNKNTPTTQSGEKFLLVL